MYNKINHTWKKKKNIFAHNYTFGDTDQYCRFLFILLNKHKRLIFGIIYFITLYETIIKRCSSFYYIFTIISRENDVK